ncbi:hypothetical protein [Piscinibacter sp. HJYY11]|uniref:hypothetical protein n=1 Tax=Piscinibacter sp. HJYY11 TaxID=2801333 RepID=UPI00191FFD35|nr:hypothetical protein [Piscinibacter sp. HJYY11]MBL0726925.1 hypothetical protein [Piscinibacter sp. HJYY11]
MKKPFRFWMTSGVAIMVAAVSGGRSLASEDERLTLTNVSRFGVSETVHRIEASAQRHGMHVLACLPQTLNEVTGESRYMLVLESSQGGTPVVMESEGAKPSLLLTVYLQQARSGHGTEVFLQQGALQDLPEGLSDQLQSDLAGLPAVVDEALSA